MCTLVKCLADLRDILRHEGTKTAALICTQSRTTRYKSKQSVIFPVIDPLPTLTPTPTPPPRRCSRAHGLTIACSADNVLVHAPERGSRNVDKMREQGRCEVSDGKQKDK